MDENKFILNRKTALTKGEKIRLYYKIDDIVLYNKQDRLTAHYPLHRSVDVKVHDAMGGKVEIFDKRMKLKTSIPPKTKCVKIEEDAFELSYDRGKCAVKVEGCLDEEYINGKKLNHIKVKGNLGYLSVISKNLLFQFL